MNETPWRRLLVDGEPVERLILDADDPGLLLGYTAFETLRTYHSRPFRLNAHLDRLRASAAAIALELPPDDQMEDEVAELLATCPIGDVELRITLTAGGRRILRARGLQPAPTSLRCATRPLQVNDSLPGWIKHGSRLAWVRSVADAGVDEVLWVDSDGLFVEGTRSNVFAVIDGHFITPPADGRLLAGVTRQVLLDVARAAGLPVAEAPVAAAAPLTELYLSSTLKELRPVVELDGRAIVGEGPVGLVVARAFRALVDRAVS
jgi:branched-chain amino acid aminotransferase